MFTTGKSVLIFLLFQLWSPLFSQSLKQYYPSVEGELVEHTYYSLDYNESHEQANWVIYFAGETGAVSRTDNFRSDPLVSTGSAQLSDFKGS